MDLIASDQALLILFTILNFMSVTIQGYNAYGKVNTERNNNDSNNNNSNNSKETKTENEKKSLGKGLDSGRS